VSRGVPGEPPLILDLGTGLRALGHDLLDEPAAAEAADDAAGGRNGSAPPPALQAVVTHLHFDHIQGLPFFQPALLDGAGLDIYGPPQAGDSLGDAFASVLRPPFFPIELDKLPAELRFHEVGDDRISLGAFDVLVRLIPHVGATCGYRVESDGISIAYVSDHQAPASLEGVADSVLELCSGADLVIHDAQYTEEEFRAKAHWGHSTIDYAVLVAREAGARRLALYHHDPTHSDEFLDDAGMEAAERAADAGLEVLMTAEGLTVDLS
jgi:ribonuclease BN (tRNA processing enzyme)